MYDRKKVHNAYEPISDQVMRPIVMFLGGKDPLKNMEELKTAVKKEQVDVKGKAVTAKMNINFAEDIQGLDLEALKEDESLIVKDSISQLRKIWSSAKKPADFDDWMYTTFMGKSGDSVSQFRNLPEISPDTLQADAGLLVNLGVWDKLPENITKMWSSPRYFVGRQIIANTYVSPFINKKSYMLYNPEEANNEKFTTPNAKILSIDSKSETAKISIKKTQDLDEIITITFEELLLLNHPQIFHKDAVGKHVFEDGIRANYS